MKTAFASVPHNWKTLQYHAFSDLVEFGAGIDVDKLAAHMTAHGYDDAEPITLIRLGKVLWILDGRHRHAAAIKAGVVPSFRLYVGSDPKAYVFKKALRQHLSASQLAMLAVEANNGQSSEEDPPNGGTKHHDGIKSQCAAAATAGVSLRAYQRAEVVAKHGTDELKDAVADGSVRVADAAKNAKEPAETQKAAVRLVRDGECKTLVQAVKQLAKSDEAPDAADETVLTDADDVVVPERCREAFATADKIESICRALDKALREAKELGESKGCEMIHFSHVDSHVKDARKHLHANRATHVCPYCLADEKKCEGCGGRGWVPKHVWSACPEQSRKKAGKLRR